MKILASVKNKMRLQRSKLLTLVALLSGMLFVAGCEQHQEKQISAKGSESISLTGTEQQHPTPYLKSMAFDYDAAVSFDDSQLLDNFLALQIFENESRLDADDFDALAYVDIGGAGGFKLIRAYEVTGQINLYLVYFKQSGDFEKKLLVYGSHDVDDGNISTSSSLSGGQLVITKTHHGVNAQEIVSAEKYLLSSNGFDLISGQGASN